MHSEGEDKTCRDQLQRIAVPLPTPTPILPSVKGWLHPPISKFLTQKCSWAKEEQGQEMRQRLKEGPSRDCPTWGSILSAETKQTLFLWSRGTCRQESQVTVLWEVRPATDSWNQPLDWANRTPWGSLGKNWKCRGGLQLYWKNNNCWQDHPVFPETRLQTQECIRRDL